MSSDVIWRGIWAAVLALSFAFVVYQRDDQQINGSPVDSKRPRYAPYIDPWLLPTYVILLSLLAYSIEKDVRILEEIFYICMGIFVHMSLYYVILAVAMPWLRRWAGSRVCASLWILPNYLYIGLLGFMEPSVPAWVIRIPHGMGKVICLVWLVGFLTVLAYYIGSHLWFRHLVLKEAEPVTDPIALSLWGQEQARAKISKRNFPLVCSGLVNTPMTIGLFRGAMKVVLPERSYTEQELTLIFRHEIIHIGLQDSWNKFFLVFCTAMCWFNPLMWMAKKRCAQDIELSCDETVLIHGDEEQKKQYAQLLLKTAGDDRGFTTCLSSSAAALRYRLQNVMGQSIKRPVGGVIAGLIFFGLIMTSGYIRFAYQHGTLQEVLYQKDISQYEVTRCYLYKNYRSEPLECIDPEQLQEYLGNLTISKLAGDEDGIQDGIYLIVYLKDGQEYAYVTLRERSITVFEARESDKSEKYYLWDPVDWDYIETLLKTAE